MNLRDYEEELRRLSLGLDGAIRELREQAMELAVAENEYRKAKAEAWVLAPKRDDNDEKLLAKQIEAWVDAESADERYRRDLAESTQKAAMEAVRGRRTQISAWQTLLNADRSELEAFRYGQDDQRGAA